MSVLITVHRKSLKRRIYECFGKQNIVIRIRYPLLRFVYSIVLLMCSWPWRKSTLFMTPELSSCYYILRLVDTSTRFAWQTHFGVRPRSTAAICGTYSLHESTIFGLRSQIDLYIFTFPSDVLKEITLQ